MNLQHVNVKLLLAGPAEVNLDPLIPVFHSWIRDKVSDELLLDIRRDLDRQLAPYRRKMTAAQMADLERRYTQKRLFEAAGVPRLSLFYLS